MTSPSKAPLSGSRSGLPDLLRKGFLLGAGLLVLLVPPAVTFLPVAKPAAAKPMAEAAAPVPVPPAIQSTPRAAPRAPATRLANFGGEKASLDARRMAHWVLSAGDHRSRSYVIVDKKNAKVFLFDSAGRLKAAAPALLGAAKGDDSAPGIGEKPLSQVLPEEKTTPAGRFIAELGVNTTGEDIVWVDYDVAVSMHRVRANVKSERRLQRLASPTADDNRISFGCINLPVKFYEKMLKPAVQAGGAVIYVLPETRSIGETFGSFYDVKAPVRVARHS